jgi:predicted PurR-regulated permease PerM
MQENKQELKKYHLVSKRNVSVEIAAFALIGILILLSLYTTYFARPVLLPVTLALLFTFLLRPVIRGLKKIKIPETVGSAIVLLALIGSVGYGAGQLSGPAREWIERAPDTLHSIQTKVKSLVSPVQKVKKTAEEFQKMTATETKEGQKIEVKSQPGLSDTFFAGIKQFFAQGAVMVILLYFLLASGDTFVEKLSAVFPRKQEKKEVVNIVSDIENSMSRYIVTVTMINIVEGIFVGLIMYFLDMPNPVLWGVMATFLIYIPYLGPLAGIGVVAVVSLHTFEATGKALLAPGLYFVVDAVQGQIITPIVLGRRFELNPVIIFMWLIFWGWIWGVPGAFMAVPLLTLFKILCDHIDALGPIGKFLEK